MKSTLLLTVATLGTLSTMGIAGTHAPIPVPSTSREIPTTFFRSEELQLDLFGVYGVGHAPDHAGPFREHVWGGGLGLNYFWTKNLGVSIDTDLTRGWENTSIGTSRKTFEQTTASIIYRIPMEEYALAPYGFAGGGITNGQGYIGSVHAGVGVEYRLIPNKLGLFADTRWTYYGDRAGKGDQNNIQLRSGVRFMF